MQLVCTNSRFAHLRGGICDVVFRENAHLYGDPPPAQTVTVDGAAYARDMFETIFKDFQQAKDVHITSLLADLMNQTPVTEADFRALKAGDYVREIEKFLEGME